MLRVASSLQVARCAPRYAKRRHLVTAVGKFALASTMAVGAMYGAAEAAQTKYEELRKDHYYYHRNYDLPTHKFVQAASGPMLVEAARLAVLAPVMATCLAVHCSLCVVTAPFTVPFAAYKRWRAQPNQK